MGEAVKLRIMIDAIPHEIDSTDPELLGKWVMEIFGRVVANGPTPATMIEVQIYPSWVPDGDPSGGRLDWIADTRIIGRSLQIHSPRELVDELGRQIDEYDKLHE